MSRRDTLYSARDGEPGSFRFDEQVVDVFPDMIDRSVPGYSLIVPMIGQLARRYVQPGSVVHDLGSSLGAVTLSIRRALRDRHDLRDVRLVATDSSAAMVGRFRQLLAGLDAAEQAAARQDAAGQGAAGQSGADAPAPAGMPVDVVHGDIRDTDFGNASLAVLNFTLQFLDLDDRDRLLTRIADGLLPGGALVLAEKVRFEDAPTQERQTEWHHDYKRLQGYSDLEIARKRNALEAVLKSETEQRHQQRLREAGFRRCTRWFQCFAFTAWLAEK